MNDQVNTRFPQEQLARMDSMVESGEYMNRQDIIRDAVRRLLKDEEVLVEVSQ